MILTPPLSALDTIRAYAFSAFETSLFRSTGRIGRAASSSSLKSTYAARRNIYFDDVTIHNFSDIAARCRLRRNMPDT